MRPALTRFQNWKEHLGLITTLVVGVALLGLLAAFPSAICVEGGTLFGFPFVFYSHCNQSGPGVTLVPGDVMFNLLALAIDVVLWFVVAAVLVTSFRTLFRTLRRHRAGG